MAADEVGFSALESAGNTEETDNVTVVAVEVLAGIGAVDADLVDLVAVFADVLDVAKYVASAVLADKVSKVGTESHVSCGRLVKTPLLNGETLEEDETLAVDEFVAKRVEELASRCWEWELFLFILSISNLSTWNILCSYLGNTSQWGGRSNEVVGSLANLLNLVLTEGVCP